MIGRLENIMDSLRPSPIGKILSAAALAALAYGLVCAQESGGGSTAGFKRPDNPPVHRRPSSSEAAGGRLDENAGPRTEKPDSGTKVGTPPGSTAGSSRSSRRPVFGSLGNIRSGGGAKASGSATQPTSGVEPPPPVSAKSSGAEPPDFQSVEAALEHGNSARDSKPPDFAEAERAYKLAANLAPEDERPFIGLGNIYYDQKRDEEAITAYRKALELQPKNRSVFEAIGDIYFRMGKYNESINATTELGLHTPRPGPFWTLTWASLASGKAKEAGHYANGFISRWKPFMEGDTPYYVVFGGYLGFREAGLKSHAEELLRAPGPSADCSDGKWHCRLLKYLRQEVPAQQLLSEATTNDRLTEARTYIGIDLVLSGQRTEALPHFLWVVENGNRDFVEYHLAKAWAEKLEP